MWNVCIIFVVTVLLWKNQNKQRKSTLFSHFITCTALFVCSNVFLVSDSSVPPETTIKYRMFQTIIRHNGLPTNIAVVKTGAEINSGDPLCPRQMWVHSRPKVRPSKVVWNLVSVTKPVSTTPTPVTCAFYWLWIERGRGWSHFPGSFSGLHLWLILNNKANTPLVTWHKMISPSQSWFRGYPRPPPKLHICSSI